MNDPGADAIEWRRLSPLTIIAQMLRGMVRAILPAGAVLFGALRESSKLETGGALLALAMLGLLVASAIGTGLRWYRQKYRVGEADVRLEQGLISRSARSVPYERIQDVSLEQAFIPRLLGLVEVRFETGAGGKDELKLAFVDEAEGERLRETVRASRESAASERPDLRTSPAPEPPTQTDPALFAMGPRRLFTFGLFEFSLVIFAVALGAVQQFEFLLPFEIWDIGEWGPRLVGEGDWLVGLGMLAQAIGIVFVVAAVVLVGLASGIIRTVLRDYGFRLDQTPRGFRRRRGLFTRTDVVMPVHRVQAVKVTTGIVRRLWGWHGLSFVSLAQDAGSANHQVAPFARMEEIGPIVEAAHFALPAASTEWHRPRRRYHRDRAVLTALGPALGALAAAFLWQPLVALALLGLGTGLAAREHWLWRYHRHALDARQVLSRRGWLAPRLVIASRVKLHSVEIAQGPVGRWRGYASLRFGLAGGTLSFDGLPPAQARQLRDGVLASIAAVDFARLPR